MLNQKHNEITISMLMIRISTCAHPLAHVANRKRSTGVDGSSFASLPPLDVGRPTLALPPPPCSVGGRPDFLELPSILRIAASAPGDPDDDTTTT